MMDKLICRIIVIIFGISSCTAQICPGDLGWLKFERKCYKFYASPKHDKTTATNICQNDGSTLLSINTFAEHQFIDKWLQTNDLARREWLTSGVTLKSGVKWDGDGSSATNLAIWEYPDSVRLTGSVVLMDYTGTDYKWIVGMVTDQSSYICEISIDEVYRISQEYRDFDYGLNVDSPRKAPHGPKFVQEPTDTVILGPTPTVDMNCFAIGLPEPEYVWMKNNNFGEMVLLTASPRIIFTSGRLTINTPVKGDHGSYQCQASNKHGVIMSQPMNLRFGDLGDFSNVAAADVDGAEYQGAQLECPYITGSPAITYQWYKTDISSFIRPNYQKHSFISANGKLYFSALATSDNGVYYCMATLSSLGHHSNFQTPSRLSLGFKLTVTSGGARLQDPDIQNDFIFVYPPTPMRGGDINLECFAYGNVPLIYSWSREGKPLPKRHSLINNNRILQLFDAGLEDDGHYTCMVYSQRTGRGTEKSLDLRIQAKPFFTYELTNQHVDIGSRLTWTCEASGRPLPTYTWYKNAKELASSVGVEVHKNHLIIDKLEVDRDSGMYQCGATNSHGTTYSSAQLRVLSIAPSFTKSPMANNIPSAIGGQVTITCNPTAAPVPSYTWMKNKIPLDLTIGKFQEDDHIKLLLNGNLLIQNILSSDQGIYTCRVENNLGDAESESILVTMDSTVISIPPADVMVEVNQSATLICEASHPLNIDMIYEWSFYSHVINFAREPEYRLGTGNRGGWLYIIGAQSKNDGLYTCTAVTALDRQSRTAYLTVKGPPGEPAGVHLKPSPVIVNSDPNHSDNTLNWATTRWLVWNYGEMNSADVTHYDIEFNTQFDRTWRVHPDGQGIPIEQTIDSSSQGKYYARLTNLKAGAMIKFRVRAINAYGPGPPSIPTPDTKIADSKPTQVVKNIRGGGGSVGDLAVVWDPMLEEDFNGENIRYVVSWRPYVDGSQSDFSKWTNKTISDRDACQFVPEFRTGLIHICKYVDLVGADNYFEPYEVTIMAKNDEGDGPSTKPQVIMSAEDLPLSAPTQVYAKQYNATALMVTWTPIPNNRQSAGGTLKGYKINYWRMKYDEEIDALQNIIDLKEGAFNLNEGLIIGLIAFEWYSFNVQAYNTAGNGPKSSDYQQQTLNRVPHEYPTEVHVYSVDGYGVRVIFRGISTQWREEPLLGYVVQYWKARENIYSATETYFGKRTTGVIRNLTSSELYQLRVYGYSRGGQGKRSSPSVYFTVGDGQILINPETMEVINTAVCMAVSPMTLALITVLTCIFSHRYWN